MSTDSQPNVKTDETVNPTQAELFDTILSNKIKEILLNLFNPESAIKFTPETLEKYLHEQVQELTGMVMSEYTDVIEPIFTSRGYDTLYTAINQQFKSTSVSTIPLITAFIEDTLMHFILNAINAQGNMLKQMALDATETVHNKSVANDKDIIDVVPEDETEKEVESKSVNLKATAKASASMK